MSPAPACTCRPERSAPGYFWKTSPATRATSRNCRFESSPRFTASRRSAASASREKSAGDSSSRNGYRCAPASAGASSSIP